MYTNKIVFHYVDGSTYTKTGYKFVGVCWSSYTVSVHSNKSDSFEVLQTDKDLIAVEVRAANTVVIHKHFDYELSVNTDIMTAKQRNKKNNKKKIEVSIPEDYYVVRPKYLYSGDGHGEGSCY